MCYKWLWNLYMETFKKGIIMQEVFNFLSLLLCFITVLGLIWCIKIWWLINKWFFMFGVLSFILMIYWAIK